MRYNNLNIYGKEFDLSHLNDQSVQTEIDGECYQVNLAFGTHCFTDEKNTGPMIYPKEKRYWSENRYFDSLALPKIMADLFADRSTYVLPFKPKKAKSEQYHYLNNGFYAIFFYLNKIDTVNKTMQLYVVSAYDKSIYNGNLPKGKSYKLTWILSQRVKGNYIIK